MLVRNRPTRLAAVLCLSLWSVIARGEDTGAISGRILDSSNGRPLSGAGIVVVGMEDGLDQTDVDGRFGIVGVPPGTYQVRISAPLYTSTVIENVEVEAGKEAAVRATLTPRADSGVEVLEVSADVTESSEATQLLKRKMAPTVSDNLGAESIAKTPDSDAAEVVTRLPSVTITDGAFVVVRGLSDRYNAALMNGGRLPSPDPTRRVVPLDLFPADFIESLSVVKSYTPDLPGDFAGGLVDIRLTDPPIEPTGSIGLSLGFNTVSTFSSFDTYDGCGADDWFGFGTHCRNLPGDFPDSLKQIQSTDLQVRKLVGSLPTNWDIESRTAPPNFGIDGSLGDTWGPFGLNIAATYGTSHKLREDETVASRKCEDCILDDFTYDRSTFETTLGAILTSKYEISKDHRINLRVLFNHTAEDEVLNSSEPGTSESNSNRSGGKDIFATSAIYTEDQLSFGQLSSQHRLGPVDIDTRVALGYTTRDQPDGKFTEYRLPDVDQPNQDPSLLILGSSDSTKRFFAELDETLVETAVDLTLPLRAVRYLGDWFPSGSVKAGALYMTRDRDFKMRIFQSDRTPPVSLTLSPDEILAPVNYSRFGFQFNEVTTEEVRRFQAQQDIAAAYLMADIPIYTDRLRLIAGARLEYSYIFVNGRIPVCPSEVPIDGCSGQGEIRRPINTLDVMPAVSLVYSLTDRMNLRGAFSQTVSRPEFRELNFALIPTAPGERPFRGNPALVGTDITNVDVRWEWFLSPLEVVSLGAFYKDLQSPIELSVRGSATSPIETRVNTDKAYLWGLEFESRNSFSFMVPWVREWDPMRPYASVFSDIELNLNVTYVDSEARGFQPPPLANNIAANDPRPLTEQAPYVINATLQYQHYRWGTFRMLYNTIGETTVAAGTANEDGSNRLDDIKRQRRDQVDFVWLNDWDLEGGTNVKLKLSVENITNDQFIETQEFGRGSDTGTSILSEYLTGTTFNVGVTYSF